jgi:hypothetical protein
MRWFLVGFGGWLVVDLFTTLLQVAGPEYTWGDAPQLLAWNLAVAPFLPVVTGSVALFLTRRPRPWVWRFPRFRTGTLMVLVAYLAFVLGMVVVSGRLSGIAVARWSKSVSSAGLVPVFRDRAALCASDARLRLANVAELRAGKIPEGLFQSQANFLRSLENNPKITPQNREYRRGLIVDSQVEQAARQQQTSDLFRRMAEYHEQLARKYDQARLRPWIPVEPDPPMPE